MSCTGKPAAARKYHTRASTLGRSQALNACRNALVALVGSVGIFVGSRCKDMCHSFAPVGYHYPVMMGRCCGL